MKKRRKWPWIALAAVAVVIILVIIFVSSAANGLKNTVYTRYDVKKGRRYDVNNCKRNAQAHRTLKK